MSSSSSGKQRRFVDSLMGRMTLMGILPAALVLAAIVAINGTRKYNLMLDNAQEELSLQSRALAAWVDGLNGAAVDVARTVAAAQTGGMFGRREETSTFMKSLLENSPQLTGVCIAYEPNADGQDKGREKGPTEDETGRFAAYWFRDWNRNNEVAYKTAHEMETGSWYQIPKRNWEKDRAARIVITEPYSYEGQFMVEQVWPIIIDGKFKGVCDVDRALSTIHDEVSRQAEAMKVDIFLVTSKGRVVCASDGSQRTYTVDPDSWQTKSVDETPHAEVFRRVIGSTQASLAFEGPDRAVGDESFYAASRIPIGDWWLVMSVPRSTVVAPIMADTLMSGGFAVVGIVVIMTLIYMPTKRLIRRVNFAAEAAQQVAAGDLTRESSNTLCPDETGDLLRALDSMTADLNTLVGQVRGASIQLNSTAMQLSTTSRQQEEVAASFGASSTEIAAAVREINVTGQELAREMEHVDEVATETARVAQEGRAQLESMEGAMQSLDQATSGVADRLAAINEKAVNIGGVVTTITKVAEQTNLLSVNAAIEAEKAGEYGRGFLVVAREIRRLADQTGQATLDIERMVKEMQGAVSSGVMEMDRFSDQVRRNVTDVRGIGRSMSDIIGRVDESTRSFGTVREGMQSQAAGAAQISEAMASLSSGAKATSEAVREFGRAATDLQSAIGTLKTAIAAFNLRS
ncbi:MAG: methyl-accepting chemotaxis protein [Phycisphaerales bacterium]